MMTEVQLPSGAIATLKAGLGRDFVRAQKMADGESALVTWALMAILARIDGQEVNIAALHKMPLRDASALRQAVFDRKAEPGKLIDGRAYKIREGTGEDLFKAERAANEPAEQSLYLLAQLLTIDGEPQVGEVMLDLPLNDVLQLLGEMNEGRPTPAPSAPPS